MPSALANSYVPIRDETGTKEVGLVFASQSGRHIA